MASTYTIFVSYLLEPTGTTLGHGYGKAIHCNYIQYGEIQTNNILSEEVRITFSTGNTGTLAGFKFLSNSVASGTGYTAHKIYALVQQVSGSTTTPNPANWKIYELTDQVKGYTTGSTFMLTATGLTYQTFRIPLHNYSSFQSYNLAYLNYPSSSAVNQLFFGDETYFLGNVSTEIHADVYVTDLAIKLEMNQFNTSSNLTWNNTMSSVSITEIGIYDANKNLVAIGKLNNPLEKNDAISRTLVFAIDF
jgi:hypothetical protein